MTREAFIRKWLGNRNFEYNNQGRDLMREDLDKIILKVESNMLIAEMRRNSKYRAKCVICPCDCKKLK